MKDVLPLVLDSAVDCVAVLERPMTHAVQAMQLFGLRPKPCAKVGDGFRLSNSMSILRLPSFTHALLSRIFSLTHPS